MMRLQRIWKRVWYRERELWSINLFAIAWVVVFAYIPMYGIIYSFFNYFPGKKLSDSEFVGLKYYIEFFSLPDVWLILRNTLVISGLNLTLGFVAPIILALLINEIRMVNFKRVIQTVSYLPHFVSWIVVASIIFTMLGNEGIVNEVLMKLGWIQEPLHIIGEGKYFWGLLTFSNIWKGIGWSSIIYIAAIAGIDQELYQAGAVDGLGRFGMAWHITLPGVRPTVLLLFILGVGSLLNAGFEQQLLLGSPTTREYHEVIDTYVYRYGIQLGRYSFATAVGFMSSILGLALVLLTNKLSKKLTDMSII
ncbi:ABC transporter permease subunit [Paenibacillus sp. sptzw28]|uniref:ABC transporter permease n=1 Tax=Paenibacillus sp. sptzw28 TaxID=715179 RepID=UPI001C6EE9A2|nr:ABC transporter permease subunit [Paenibacillus sp. sptzw28]QYR22567.1 ABC transporter permease subunit [Paenibacillus sp. sptzw28]